MKHLLMTAGIALLGFAGLVAFRGAEQSSIVGKVSPADGAAVVWAVSDTDTTTANIIEGAFSLGVKSGTYKVVVDATEPYKDAVLDNIEVKDTPVDLGEIKLEQ